MQSVRGEQHQHLVLESLMLILYKDKFEKETNNAINTWNIINLLVNTKGQKNFPSKFNTAGHHTSSSHDIANAFNNYFTQVGPSLYRQIPHVNTNYGVHLTNPNENSIFLNPVTKTEMCIILLVLMTSNQD